MSRGELLSALATLFWSSVVLRVADRLIRLANSVQIRLPNGTAAYAGTVM